MSDTPRTNAAFQQIRDQDSAYGAQPVTNLCRRLERELAAVTAERNALRAQLQVAHDCETAATETVVQLRDTLKRIGMEFTEIHLDSGISDPVWEIYHLLRECGAIKSKPQVSVPIAPGINVVLR